MTDVHALAGAYVLDAVDDIERTAFARHLAECDACAVETDELRAAVAHLADGAWSVPPPRLRTEVLTRVSRTRQERPPTAQRGGTSRWRRLTLVAAAVIVLGGAGTVTGVAVHDERAAQTQADAQNEQIRAILGAPDATVRRVAVKDGGQLTVVTSASRDAGVVMLSDAQSISSSKAYQLWLIKDKVPVSAGVMAAGAANGTAVVHGLSGSSGVAMSRERASGANTPSRVLAQVLLT